MSLRGCATGIGSLPYTEVEPALDLIFSCCPAIPFWPQLPRRGPIESMLAQFSEHFPCLKFTPEGIVFDPSSQDSEMERFYDRLIAQDTEYFAISAQYASGLWGFHERLKRQDLGTVEALKLHVTGPFTFAASINDSNGVPLLHDQVLMQAFVKGLAMKAAWQIKQFRPFGKRMIVFLDEPYLSSFGSAFTSVNREEVIAVLSEFCAVLAADDVYVGVHCCGNTDWSLFTGIPGLSVINFDAFEFLDRIILYASDLQKFLSAGGFLCWGIVPTLLPEQPHGLSEGALVKRIREGIGKLADKGVDAGLLAEQLLVSPACGLGNRDVAGARDVLGLLQRVSGELRR